jgi:hypothetical protein
MVSEVSGIRAGSAPTGGGFTRIPLSDIQETRAGREADDALRASVKQFGVLQPVLVARHEGAFKLLAGARRLHAARSAGLTDVPAIIIPPDRAGELDVFLDENLLRTELSPEDRIRLRDQWMRESGRDEHQAARRIPDTKPAPAIMETSATNPWWKYATLALAVACVALVVIAARKPAATPVSDEMLPPVETVEVVPPPVDNTWMDAFRFPGSARLIEPDQLSLVFAQPMFEGPALTPRGALYLNQLAAIATASGASLSVEIIGYGADAASPGEAYALAMTRARGAAEHLRDEGIDESRITARGLTRLPEVIGYEQTAQIILRR